MHRWATTTAAVSVTMMLWTGAALAQAKPACDPQGRVVTPQKVDAQVIKVDAAQGKVTVREPNGTTHEFQASKEAIQDLKVGDRIEANLKEAPKCP
jgi:Cu/Ag efflux protein CusF